MNHTHALISPLKIIFWLDYHYYDYVYHHNHLYLLFTWLSRGWLRRGDRGKKTGRGRRGEEGGFRRKGRWKRGREGTLNGKGFWVRRGKENREVRGKKGDGRSREGDKGAKEEGEFKEGEEGSGRRLAEGGGRRALIGRGVDFREILEWSGVVERKRKR